VAVVYFAHSYRDEDSDIVGFFLGLIEREGLTPSLDPPSNELNLAKPQRHLRSSDGLVAVLTRRGDAVSPYILFEVGLALRAGKPVLAFVQDDIPDEAFSSDVLPSRVLQVGFSRRTYLRQIRELRHAVRDLKSYIGTDPAPLYRVARGQRTCLVLGVPTEDARFAASELAKEHGYRPVALSAHTFAEARSLRASEAVAKATVAICFLGPTDDPSADYLIGLTDGNFVPAIRFMVDPKFQFDPVVPIEYQPRLIPDAPADVSMAIAAELRIFEQDYLEIDDQDKVARYARQLLAEGDPTDYRPETRIRIEEVVMGDRVEGDKYEHFQGVAVGRNSSAERVIVTQTWNEISGSVDLDKLSEELAQLRAAMRREATDGIHDMATAEVAKAEEAAREKDGPQILEHLRAAGRWALDVAMKYGLPVAVELIKKAVGLP
jgi:hypothetical protein